MRESRGLAHNHPYASPAVPARAQFFHAALIQHGRRRRAVFYKYLGELAAALQSGAEDALQDFLFNKW
jgi:hypothetical protein